MTIREERSDDAAAIRRVVEEAFDRPDEADLVDKLRANGKFTASLVAELDGQVVGHILFTIVVIDDADPQPKALGARSSGGTKGVPTEGCRIRFDAPRPGMLPRNGPRRGGCGWTP
jgi:hypothetical protein